VELAAFQVLGHRLALFESRLPSGVPLYLLANGALFERGGGPYQADDGLDWEDNALRFGVLSKAAAILGTGESPLDWRPDVVHCQDWPAALAPVWLADAAQPRAGSLVTIHSLEFYGRYSFLKGGLTTADAINTVSPTYAREIQTEEFGCGLDGVLRRRADVLSGVLNGIDTAEWNPMTDALIPSPYGVLTLERKALNKRALKKRLALTGGDEIPLFGLVSRLTHQKGIDILAEAIDGIEALGAQLAIVGAGDREMVGGLKAAAERHPGKVGLFVGFDEALAHLVEAGSDAFLMPSRFEPCGMNQMYSQRYGTPPVVSRTGGLVDTVSEDTGFLMDEVSVDGLVDAVGRAMAAWMDPKRWKRLQGLGMMRDFGWEAAARQYHAIYERIRPTS
jgi:starch synthase